MSTGTKFLLQNATYQRYPPHCASKGCCSKPTHQASGPIIDDENIHLFINQNSLPCFLVFFGIFYSIFGIFSIPFMAFIVMSVSECILNIQMLAQDDLKSFLKIAKKTFKFLEKNDYFYNCD